LPGFFLRLTYRAQWRGLCGRWRWCCPTRIPLGKTVEGNTSGGAAIGIPSGESLSLSAVIPDFPVIFLRLTYRAQWRGPCGRWRWCCPTGLPLGKIVEGNTSGGAAIGIPSGESLSLRSHP
jgi:hypothetical protein